MDQRIYRLFCYGKPYAELATIREAKAAAEEHIRETCPHGSMPWAKRVMWIWWDGTDQRSGYQLANPGWASAAKGEWLDHRIDEVRGGRRLAE